MTSTAPAAGDRGDAGAPRALWFGRARAGCFGMLHRPAAPSTRGVVLCNTLGFDGLIAYRALRHLADDLSERGFWSLRFDYDGEGDSAGGPWEPDRVDAWLASIQAAVDVLRARGVTDVQLVGLRAGASLAHLYAAANGGISGVVLLWPCVSGSTYVRELRALSRLSAAARPVQRVTADRFPQDSLEVCGFEFTAGTLADLARVDLVATPPHSELPRVLLIERSDMTPNDALARALGEAGVSVEHEHASGYAEFMTNDEVKSVSPAATLHRIADWLDWARPEATTADPPVALVPAIVETTTLSIDDPAAGRFTPAGPPRSSVVEEQAWINDRLFAIVTSPVAGAATRRASIVMCTTGANNRTGPGRLYVNLARYWASLGFNVLRVDLGGVGDSAGAGFLTRIEPHAPIRIEELRETVAWIRERTGVDRVVLFGLCSGAFNAFHAAIDGVDINHVIMANPGMFYLGADQTASTSAEARLGAAHDLRRGLMNPRKWRLALREPQVFKRSIRRVPELLRAGATDGFGVAFSAVARNTARRIGLHVEAPSPLPRDLEKIRARGIRTLMIFAAGESTAHYVRMFAGNAFNALLLHDGLQLVQIDGGDHVFASPGARQRLFEAATGYLEREYPVADGLAIDSGVLQDKQFLNPRTNAL